MSRGHAREIERPHGEWPGYGTVCSYDVARSNRASTLFMVVCGFRDVDLGCILPIFPGLSQHIHRIAQFSCCGDAMSYRVTLVIYDFPRRAATWARRNNLLRRSATNPLAPPSSQADFRKVAAERCRL